MHSVDPHRERGSNGRAMCRPSTASGIRIRLAQSAVIDLSEVTCPPDPDIFSVGSNVFIPIRWGISMEYEKILLFVRAQRSRHPQPMMAFTKSLLELLKSLSELQSLTASQPTKTIFTHLAQIHFVTVIECYFRDILGAIFKICNPEAFAPALGKLAKQKYSVQEIVELEAKGLHILQVLTGELKFQNLHQITSVFDNFFPSGFIKSISEHKYRFGDLPDKIMEVNSATLRVLNQVFSERHELVHNPSEELIRGAPQDMDAKWTSVWCFVFCSNMVIEEFIANNAKKSFLLEVEGSAAGESTEH